MYPNSCLVSLFEAEENTDFGSVWEHSRIMYYV